MRRAVVLLAIAALLLAGCSSSKSSSPTTTFTPTQSSAMTGTTTAASTTAQSPYTLTITDFPTLALNKGSPFGFTLNITGPARSSDHIGAHYASASAPNPTVAYGVSCNHVSGAAPGIYSVTCTAPNEAGTYYLRGHIRFGSEPGAANYWSAEKTFTVA